MHFVAVLNKNGGTFRTTDMAAFRQEAVAVFARHGHTIDCRVVAGGEVTEALEVAADEEGVDVLLAGGGDGTISTAAEVAFRTGKPLAVLPAGTMNLFARTLGIPLSLSDALETLASGQFGRADIATANGRPFVHQFGVGVHARLVRIRDGLTYHSRIGKMLASVRAVGATILRPPRFVAEMQTPRGLEKWEASGIEISNNPVGDWHIPYADTHDRGVLGVYVAKPMSEWALAKLMVAVLFGHWRTHPDVSEQEVREVVLTFPRRKRSAQAVIDGELIPLEPRVELKIHPAALTVIVPVGSLERSGALVDGGLPQ
ncbi:MAG: diacylglycerol kinase family lipid kinase [Devosia nanyangense]|nr:diacylglycerol kinase family lipid kinase [Devosia nanyangense]